MRQFTRIACLPLLTVACLAGSQPALAEGGSWDCSTPQGTFDTNNQAMPPQVQTISGRIRFDAGDSGKWVPMAKVVFTDTAMHASPGCECGGLRASINRTEPDIVKFSLIADGQEKGIAQASLGVPITFSVSITRAGVLTVRIGKSTPRLASLTIRHPHHDNLRLSCSSASVSFTDLTVQ